MMITITTVITTITITITTLLIILPINHNITIGGGLKVVALTKHAVCYANDCHARTLLRTILLEGYPF